MSSKRLQVTLGFEADTTAAMRNLQTLRTTLNEISSLPHGQFGANLSNDMKIAAQSASELQSHLGAAMNTKTGNLDMNKLNASLKASNTSLSTLTSNLLRAGTTGEKAFLATYSAISRSNISLKQSNGLLNQFMLTLKNTAKWQLSSSLIHGVVSGLSSAVGYAKDLNESLNNIQIVTGLSSENMAEFAKQANKAAKELKTTTVAYTDAALIYYQQGLSGKAVTDRADTTVKLANVTSESAETVSEWMTSIWNNFDDGSKKLEYYADTVAALGAATASSADEIAQGLEKFAAVAETVGLSYEYATSALATVTAQTRQSADVVGTAFKTLFARIQDLELGNTLDDGTTLGSYSEALYKVGINIKDQTGGLKDMNLILDEMGAKWETLDKDQQVALAKSVAGIRQYTQLIALMDNYDTFKVNLSIAENAEGTLEEQSQIYEKSWKAASKNVKASLEEMYSVLIPEDTLIDLTNGLADVVSGFTDVLEAAGGLKTILLLIATTVLKKFSTQIAFSVDNGISKFNSLGTSVKNVFSNIKEKGVMNSLWGGIGKVATNVKKNVGDYNVAKLRGANVIQQKQQERTDFQNETQENLKNASKGILADGSKVNISAGFKYQVEETARLEEYNSRILNIKNKMTDAEYENLKIQRDQVQATIEENAQHKNQLEQLKQELSTLAEIDSMHIRYKDNGNLPIGGQEIGLSQLETNINGTNYNLDEIGYNAARDAGTAGLTKDVDYSISKNANGDQIGLNFSDTGTMEQVQSGALTSLANLGSVGMQLSDTASSQAYDSTPEDMDKKRQAMIEVVNLAEKEGKINGEISKVLKEQVAAYDGTEQSANKINQTIKKIQAGMEKTAKAAGATEKAINGAKNIGVKMGNATNNLNKGMGKLKGLTASIEGNLAKVVARQDSLGSLFSKGISGASQLFMGINMVTSAFEQMKKEGMGIANISSLLMGMGMIIPGLISTYTALQGVIVKVIGAITAKSIATKADMALSQAEAAMKAKNISLDYAELYAENELNEEKTEQLLIQGYGLSADQAEAAMTAIKTKIKLAESEGRKVNVGSIIAETVAQQALNAATLWWTIAIVALIAIIILIASLFSKQAAAQREATQAQIDNAKQNLESIKANQELAQSVSDLTEKYNELQDSGKSTYETFTELNKQIPKLIESYEELSSSLGINIDIAGIREAYELFKAIGDISYFQNAQEKADEQIAYARRNEAITGAKAAGDKMVEAASSGDGSLSGTKYKVELGGTNTQTVTYNGESMGEEKAGAKILEEELGDMYANDVISFDTTSAESMWAGYQGMMKAREKMEASFTAEQLSHMDTYRELKRELEEMKEGAAELEAFMDENFQASSEEFLADNSKKQLELLNNYYGEDGITSLKEYKEQRDSLIDSLEKEYHITEEQAKALLNNSEAFGKYELAIKKFAEDGEFANYIRQNTELSLEEIQAWYETLPEEDKTLFVGIDFANVSSIDEAEKALAELRDEAERNSIREDAIASEIDANQLDMYAQMLANSNSALEENSALTDQVALNILKFNKGLKSLQGSLENNLKILKSENKLTPEYAQALSEVHDALEETFGISVSADFIASELDLINDVASGNVEKLNELQDKIAENYILELDIRGFSINDNAMVNINEIKNNLFDMLSDLDTSIEYGEGSQLSGDYLNTLQDAIDAGQITEQQLEGLMRAKGYELKITGWKEVEGPKKTITRKYKDWSGQDIEEIITETETMQVPIINGEGEAIKGSTAPASVHKIDMASSINSSMTEKQKDKAKEFKNMEESIKRYHEIELSIDKVTRSLDRLSKAADRAYGQNKLNLIDQQIEKTEELKNLNNQLLAETEKYEKEDRTKFESALSKVGGGTIRYDDEGNVVNREELERNAINWLEGQGKSDEAQEVYDEFTKYLEQYVGTVDKKIALKQTIEDQKYEIQDLNFEKIQYKIDLRVELNEMDLRQIERTIENLGDDLFSRAELYGEMFKQVDIYQDGLDNLSTAHSELKEARNADKISQADYIDGLKNIMDNAYESADALRELRKEMKTFYSDTLDQGYEEYQKYFDFMSHGSEVLEHYNNILEIAGEENDYWKKGKILDSVANSKLKQLESNVKYFETMQKQTAEQEKQLAKRQADFDKAKRDYEKDKTNEELKLIYETAKENLEREKLEFEAALSMQNEVELAMLESAEEYAQALADIYENEMNKAKRELELQLSGGVGFDYLNANMERISASTEEWYDNTNKIYETNKMMKKIQQDIDKSTNLAAKQKLKTFQEQTKQLQNQEKLSKIEMDIQQKRYDLLLAEIALEEAQNAKNQVRLQRDSEGNFGYIYTANQQDVSQAQQRVDDAKNVLYNTGVERYQKYSQSYYTILQEYYEQLNDLNDNRASMTEEEYERQLNELHTFYNNMLTDYIYLGQVSFLAEEELLANEFKNGWSEIYSDIFNETNLSLNELASRWLLFTEQTGNYHKDFNQSLIDGDRKLYGDLVQNFLNYQSDLSVAQAEYQLGWFNIFNSISGSALGMKVAINNYAAQAKANWTNWKNDMTKINKELGVDLISNDPKHPGLTEKFSSVEGAIGKVAEKGRDVSAEKGGLKTLEKQIENINSDTNTWHKYLVGENGEGGLVNDLQEVYDKADDATTEFASHLLEIKKLETAYENLAADMRDVIKLEGGDPGEPPEDIPGPEEPSTHLVAGENGPGTTAVTSDKPIMTGGDAPEAAEFGIRYKSGSKVITKSTLDDNFYLGAFDMSAPPSEDDKVDVVQLGNQLTYTKYGAELVIRHQGKYYRPQNVFYSADDDQFITPQDPIDISKIPLSLSHVNFNTKNANYVARYGEDATYDGIDHFCSDETALEALQKLNIIGKRKKSDGDYLYRLDDPWLFTICKQPSEDSPGTTYLTGTYWINSTDLSQILGISKDDLRQRYNYLSSFDTGGYTGDWGPEGRWALLHQKEIVLNAHDTENFLAGINILRDITKAIDLQAMSYNGLINNYLPYLQNTNTNTLQQDVTIHAEFPNATDHNEIQLAIEGLVNSAAQRANRK